MNKKKIIVVVAGVLIIALYFLSLSDPLETEYKWYKKNGYEIFKLNYGDVLDSLPLGVTVNEVSTSKTDLRKETAEELAELGTCLIAYCPDERFICVIGDFNPDTNVARVYYWEP